MGSSPSGHAQLQAGGWTHHGLWQVPSEPTANGGCVRWGWTPEKPTHASGVPLRRMPTSFVPGAAPNTGGGCHPLRSSLISKSDGSASVFAVAAPTCAGAVTRVVQSCFPHSSFSSC